MGVEYLCHGSICCLYDEGPGSRLVLRSCVFLTKSADLRRESLINGTPRACLANNSSTDPPPVRQLWLGLYQVRIGGGVCMLHPILIPVFHEFLLC